ncbi:unnamed protein product [Bemisia tabaci]|uniref:Uncharacterized protein n=1 Tax=Bemisia tabaci TaxID=7038 RepID=A0A9P0AL43_BEMTA|nr:unnamed protein product [Bemisia tabaci]
MSFVHANSCDCSKSELDLFSLPPTQSHIEHGQWVVYKPISSLQDQTPIEFVVAGQGSDYLDLSQSLLSIKAKIVKNDDSALAAADDNLIGPINNWMHSLFSQVDVYLNQKIVSSSSNAYPYRAYFENLLSYGPGAKNSHLTSVLWYKDTAGHMEVADNAGLTTRRGFSKRSKTVEMIGHIHSDIFSQDKMLLNNVELKLRLVRSRDDFCLLGQAGYKVKIFEANLFARRVKVSPSVLISHAKGLESTTAKYPITRADVKSNTVPAGVHSVSLDNVVSGQLPTRIIMGMVSNTAFNGDVTLNPFNFQNFGLDFASFHIDGQQIPGVILTPNFDSEEYIRSFHTLFSGTGIHYSDSGNEIDRTEYKNGYGLIALDFTPDLEAHIKSHWSLVRHGSLRIELRFKAALAEAITVITYAEFDNVIEIDKSRNVIVDFGA